MIDYGQSKQLPDGYRAAFARLIVALDAGDVNQISEALDRMGVETERDDRAVKKEMAIGMFDTSGKYVYIPLKISPKLLCFSQTTLPSLVENVGFMSFAGWIHSIPSRLSRKWVSRPFHRICFLYCVSYSCFVGSSRRWAWKPLAAPHSGNPLRKKRLDN